MAFWDTPSFWNGENIFSLNTKNEWLNISPKIFDLPEFKIITDESIKARFKLKEEIILSLPYDDFLKKSENLNKTEIDLMIDFLESNEKFRLNFIKKNNYLIDREKNPKAYKILKEAKKIEYKIKYYDIYKILDKYKLDSEDKFNLIENLKWFDDIVIIDDIVLEKYKSISEKNDEIKWSDIKKIIDIYFNLLWKEITSKKRKLKYYSS